MRLGGTDLEVVVADITALKVDAIANVANAALERSAGGGTGLWSTNSYAFKSN